MVLLFLITSFLGCTVQHNHHHNHKRPHHSHHHKKTPPGHAKKKAGSKSAKAHAPGHKRR